MDKYDYITATIEEEKIRLEKLIKYLKENNSDELPEYQERYNNILKYLNAKEKYFNIENIIREYKTKLEELRNLQDEYELDNILLEDTLLSKFHEDTENVYRNISRENIKDEDENLRNVLSLLFDKQSNYLELVVKRNRLKNILNKKEYPNTYSTLISQGVLIEKQNNIMDEIYLIENNIKMEEEKLKKIENEVMTTSILKILYEFWIIDTYEKEKVNKSKLFKDNRALVNIKNDISETSTEEITIKEEVKPIPVIEEEKINEIVLPDLNLPGINEDTLIDIDGRNYIN